MAFGLAPTRIIGVSLALALIVRAQQLAGLINVYFAFYIGITIGTVPKEVINHAKKMNITLHSSDIYLTDGAILHMLRDVKEEAGKAITMNELIDIEKNLINSSIYYDGSYIFVYKKDNRLIKYVMGHNQNRKINDKKITCNLIITRGKLQDAILTWRE